MLTTPPDVIKVGGALLQDPKRAHAFLEGVARRDSPCVLIHGGGPAVSAMADRLGVSSHFVDGLRVTSPALMQVAEMVQVGVVSRQVVSGLTRAGSRAIALSGPDMGGWLRAHQIQDGVLGRVGEIRSVDCDVLLSLLAQGVIPVVAPVAVDDDLESLNVNADQVAYAIAAALGAHALHFASDVEAVLGPDGPVAELAWEKAEHWLADGTVTGGMGPKLRSCHHALLAGVSEVHIGQTRVRL
ncbi:MAG: acetylglutamate kinase [Cognaticolwellia sp.]|jgi:acetylglutamate kinase